VPSGWGERVSRLYSPETWRHIVDLGAAAGFAFNATSPLSDTLDSHRLMVLAYRVGAGAPSLHLLFTHLYSHLSIHTFSSSVATAAKEPLAPLAASSRCAAAAGAW
jgi:hypothetical protein